MAEVLSELLAAGLIERLDGDDERFAKMERASETVARELAENPPWLIEAMLAGLDPDISADDPAIAQASEALVAEWRSMNSVYTSPPIGLFRAILLDSCSRVAEGPNAAILWFTGADTFPLYRLGKEEAVVRRLLRVFAERTEEAALAIPAAPAPGEEAAPTVVAPAKVVPRPLGKVDRDDLLSRVAAAVGPKGRGNIALQNSNRYAPNQPNWSWEFADRMSALLADQLDALSADINKQHAQAGQQLHVSQVELVKAVHEALTSHQRWMHDALQAGMAQRNAEQRRLDALWWSKALYSAFLGCGYRELPSPLAAVVMAFDLLDQVSKPTPASVGYLLAETVNRLDGAGFNAKHPLPELLAALREARTRLPDEWLDRVNPPPREGRISVRDLVVLALGPGEWNAPEALRRAGLAEDITLSLPELAHAVFRQEQAVQLAKASR